MCHRTPLRRSHHRAWESRRGRRSHTSGRTYAPAVALLEDRTLPALDLAGAAALAPGVPQSGEVGSLGAVYYQVTLPTAGLLTTTLGATGFTARLSLVDARGLPLVQSDGPDTASVSVHVPAGTEYLEVESLAGSGTYSLLAQLAPAAPPSQPVPVAPGFNAVPLALGDFSGDGSAVLVGPDGIHPRLADGSFAPTPVGGPIAADNEIATGIAVGAFQDGRPLELAVAETDPYGVAGDVRILAVVGDGFQVVSTFPVAPNPSAIQTVALGDGQLALAVASGQSDEVALYRDDGQGNFTLWQTLDATAGGGSNPVGLAVGNAADGRLALFVADAGSDPSTTLGQAILVFSQNADGQFEFAQAIALPDQPWAVVAGDFGNGRLDLAVTCVNSNSVAVFLGSPDGSGRLATTPQRYRVGVVPDVIVAADFNGDGRPDLATANENSGDVSVLLGNGDGTFQPERRSGAAGFPSALAAGDVNGDGRTDLLVGDAGASGVTVLLGNGDGSFQDQTRNNVDEDPVAVVPADFNHDGHPDLVTVNQAANDVSILLGRGDGSFLTPTNYAVGINPTAVAVGDFNGDGRPDLAVTFSGDPNSPTPGGGVTLLLGNGDGTFQGPFDIAGALLIPGDIPSGETVAAVAPTAIVAGDFNGDGALDLAVVAQIVAVDPAQPWIQTLVTSVTVLLGDGHGGFAPLSPVDLGPDVTGPRAIVAGDLSGSGHLDLVVADALTGPDGWTTTAAVTILQGDGRGGFPDVRTLDLGAGPGSAPLAMTLVDAGGGGLRVAVVSANPNGDSDVVTVVRSGADGVLTAGPPVPLPAAARASALTTVRQDVGQAGALAVVVSDGSGDPDSYQAIILDAQGDPLPSPPVPLGAGGFPTAVAAADFTGSGRSDLAVARFGPDDVDVLLNQGFGRFVTPSAAVLAPRDNPVVADFTGSGLSDVAIVDGAGDILLRMARSSAPGDFQAPILVNPGNPSRDIAAVATVRGVEIASVDAADDFVSLYVYEDGHFSLFGGKLPTGAQPAQVVSADLRSNGRSDFVVRNAGDGTLSVFLSDGAGGFAPPIRVDVGAGASNLAVADVNGDSLPDLLVTNATTGAVEVSLNQGDGVFGPPTLYRAGSGLAAVTGVDDGSPPALSSRDRTAGAAAVPATAGGPDALVTLNPGTNTVGLLTGLGGGRFANAVAMPTVAPATVVRTADVNGDGVPDLVLLSAAGVTIAPGNGFGGFGPATTYPAGANPTGLAVTSENGLPVLLVGDPQGDLLVLLGDGAGHFAPPSAVADKVSLAVVPVSAPGSGPSSFVFANQSLSQLVVKSGPGAAAPARSLGSVATGLLRPSAVATAELNGDGVLDLVVVNSGANNVVVYPGLPGGGFGPALNGGIGFATGTDPVAVTVADANGDGRPDLIVADRGSNDVAILLNQPRADGFTFVPGPRLQVGAGPVGAALIPGADGGPPNLVVSNSVSNNLSVLQGRGNGFFDDAHPTVIPLGFSPGPIEPGPGDSVVTVNPSTSTVTLFNGLASSTPTWTTIGSGGVDPVAALGVRNADGSEELVVANYGSGTVALLSIDARGISLIGVQSPPGLPNPTDLALGGLNGAALDVYAATAGADSAALVTFLLGGSAPSGPPALGGGLALALQPLTESSLPLVATLLVPLTETGDAADEDAALVALATAAADTVAAAGPSAGQSLLTTDTGPRDGDDSEPEEEAGEADEATDQTAEETPVAAPWARSVLGLDEAFEQLRQRTEDAPPPDVTPQTGSSTSRAPERPADPPRLDAGGSTSVRFEAIDAAIAGIATEDSAPRTAPGPADPDHRRSAPGLALLCGSLLFTIPRLTPRAPLRLRSPRAPRNPRRSPPPPAGAPSPAG